MINWVGVPLSLGQWYTVTIHGSNIYFRKEALEKRKCLRRFSNIELTAASPLSPAMAEFHVQPRSVRAEEAGMGRFQCQIHGLPEPAISWEKDGRSVDTKDERYSKVGFLC